MNEDSGSGAPSACAMSREAHWLDRISRLLHNAEMRLGVNTTVAYAMRRHEHTGR